MKFVISIAFLAAFATAAPTDVSRRDSSAAAAPASAPIGSSAVPVADTPNLPTIPEVINNNVNAVLETVKKLKGADGTKPEETGKDVGGGTGGGGGSSGNKPGGSTQ